jgi:hypothetical protein
LDVFCRPGPLSTDPANSARPSYFWYRSALIGNCAMAYSKKAGKD